MPLLILPKSALLREPGALLQIFHCGIFPRGMGLIHAAGKHDSADSMLREGVAVAAAEGLRQFPGKTQFFRRPAEIFSRKPPLPRCDRPPD